MQGNSEVTIHHLIKQFKEKISKYLPIDLIESQKIV
jgi:hypothetical protein